ncbi:putative leader peptide [Streptomyces sp. NPDC058691]
MTVVQTVSFASFASVVVLASPRQVHLYSRPHIDLQRVAGSLCSS